MLTDYFTGNIDFAAIANLEVTTLLAYKEAEIK